MLPFLPPDVPPIPPKPVLPLAQIDARYSALAKMTSPERLRQELIELVQALVTYISAQPFDPPRIDNESQVVQALNGGGTSDSAAILLRHAYIQLSKSAHDMETAQAGRSAPPWPLHDQVRTPAEEPELVAAILSRAKHKKGIAAYYYGGELLLKLDANVPFQGAVLLDGALIRFRAPASLDELPKGLRIVPNTSPRAWEPQATPWIAAPQEAFAPVGRTTPADLVASFAETNYLRYGLSMVAWHDAGPRWRFSLVMGTAAQWPSELISTDGGQLHAYRLPIAAPPQPWRFICTWAASQLRLRLSEILSQGRYAVDRLSIQETGEFPDYAQVISGASHMLTMSAKHVKRALTLLRAAPKELDRIVWRRDGGSQPLALCNEARQSLVDPPELPASSTDQSFAGPSYSFVDRARFTKALAAFAHLPYGVAWYIGGSGPLDPWLSEQADDRAIIRQWHMLMPTRMD